MSLILSYHTGNSRSSPILVRLFEVRCSDTSFFEGSPKSFKLQLVANSQINNRGVLVRRTTKKIRILDRCMGGLYRLLSDWDIPASNGIKIMFEVLGFHDALTSFCLRFVAW